MAKTKPAFYTNIISKAIDLGSTKHTASYIHSNSEFLHNKVKVRGFAPIAMTTITATTINDNTNATTTDTITANFSAASTATTAVVAVTTTSTTNITTTAVAIITTYTFYHYLFLVFHTVLKPLFSIVKAPHTK